MNLLEISKEIKDLIESRRQKIQLSFIEEDHIYFMLNENGELRSDFPSVSKVLKEFYNPFDDNLKSFQMSGGDVLVQRELLKKHFKNAAIYSSNANAEGVDLSHSKYFIIYSSDYSGAKHIQRRERIININGSNTLKVIFLLVKNSIK